MDWILWFGAGGIVGFMCASALILSVSRAVCVEMLKDMTIKIDPDLSGGGHE